MELQWMYNNVAVKIWRLSEFLLPFADFYYHLPITGAEISMQ